LNSIENSFSPKQQEQFMQKMFKLLMNEATRYNGVDSTSMPIEKAQSIMESIMYSLSVIADNKGISATELFTSDCYQLLTEAQALLEQKCKSLYFEWAQICHAAPQINNVYYVSTLKNIGSFFDRYDIYYGAHEIPCSIDYPLMTSVSESLKGISYIESYLNSIRSENQFINSFGEDDVRKLLKHGLQDYTEGYYNICELVYINAIGKILARDKIDTLIINAEELEILKIKLIGKGEKELLSDIETATIFLLQQIHFEKTKILQFKDAAQSLVQRLSSIRERNDITNIFIH